MSVVNDTTAHAQKCDIHTHTQVCIILMAFLTDTQVHQEFSPPWRMCPQRHFTVLWAPCLPTLPLSPVHPSPSQSPEGQRAWQRRRESHVPKLVSVWNIGDVTSTGSLMVEISSHM